MAPTYREPRGKVKGGCKSPPILNKKIMITHLKNKAGRRFCDPKKGGFLTREIKRCSCKECLSKLEQQNNNNGNNKS